EQDQHQYGEDDLAVDAVEREPTVTGERRRLALHGGLVQHPAALDPRAEAEDGVGDGGGLDDDLRRDHERQDAIRAPHDDPPLQKLLYAQIPGSRPELG